jgi:lipopolysaccharide/colanic/teichoic acid biosynthesis glycosyltransferase
VKPPSQRVSSSTGGVGVPYDRVKRVGDVAFAFTALVLTAPFQVAVALLVRRSMGRPALFRQTRPGLDGRPFVILKFRTMRQVDESRGHITDADRLTRLGSGLRSLSLDELPTLWNVLRGDMSLVGPRPLLIDYLPLYTVEQARRNQVRPGITGLAQVRGRNAISWERKFEADVEYVDRRSLALDMRILGQTVWSVVRREGISATGEATMPAFTGANTPNDGA